MIGKPGSKVGQLLYMLKAASLGAKTRQSIVKHVVY